MTYQFQHIAGSVLLHGLIFALLTGGVQCSRKVTTPPVIQAQLLDGRRDLAAEKRRQAEEELRRQREEAERLKQDQQKKEDEEKKKVEEAQRQKEAEEKRVAEEKQKAEEKAKTEEAERVRIAAEKKKKEEDEAKRKVDEEKKRVEAEKKKKEDEARREREQKEAERKQAEDEFRKQMEQEELAREDAAERAALSGVANEWYARIVERVRANYRLPPGYEADFSCKVAVKQLPDGHVVDVKVVQSCGNPILDGSVENAVRNSDPLPQAPDPKVFDREIEFTFRP